MAETLSRTAPTLGRSLSPRDANPFRLPQGEDFTTLRAREKEAQKLERDYMRSLTLTEKTALKLSQTRRAKTVADEEDTGSAAEGSELPHINKSLDDLTLQTRSRHIERESLADYIRKKRELFLVQYSLGVKNEEIRRLEESAQHEESKLNMAEQTLELDAAKFDAFLKENDRTSVEAMKQAEAQTKAKLERQAEIKRLQADITATKSAISKYEDHLRELHTYRDFLHMLSPAEWLARHRRPTHSSSTSRAEARGFSRQASRTTVAASLAPPKLAPTRSSTNLAASGGAAALRALKRADEPAAAVAAVAAVESPEVEDEKDDLEDGSLYFTDPQQLLRLFAELEEHNLSLIQNGQETEEQLQDLAERVGMDKAKLAADLGGLKSHVDELEASIEEVEERARRFKMHHDFFLSSNADEQDAELARLNTKVEEVYRSCIGENEASISTLQMLTNIENRLEELFEKIEKMPPTKVEEAEKAKEKLRRLRAREEKLEAQRKHQEERVRRALERAKAEPKKQTGKKLMFRSAPPKAPRRIQKQGSNASLERSEEHQYFFGTD